MVPRKRWLKPFQICLDCASTVRPLRVQASTNGKEARLVFSCDCGASRWIIYQKVDKQ